jgi:hypothetical protein
MKNKETLMATNNSYQALVEGFARLLSEGDALSSAGLVPPKRPPVGPRR